MRETKFGFVEGFLAPMNGVPKNKPFKSLDWDKAAEIIKEKYKLHKDLRVEAGLEGDWNYTGGIIFEEGKPTNDDYTYLESNWATPTLILSYGEDNEESIECFITDEVDHRFDSDSKWDEISLGILELEL